ncbi:phage tail assembly protein [Pseudomonas sp. GG8]
MTQAIEKKTPSWLDVSDEGVTVTFKYPTELNAVKVGKVFMRPPSVRDLRAAEAGAKGDAEAREMSLFSSLTEVGEKDLVGLKLLDYRRLQEGYFRLVDEDEL